MDGIAAYTFFSLPLVGRVDASETSVGVGVQDKRPHPTVASRTADAKHRRYVLKNGDRRSPTHPPRAFRGGGIGAYSVR
jgi:hypothetical protein